MTRSTADIISITGTTAEKKGNSLFIHIYRLTELGLGTVNIT